MTPKFMRNKLGPRPFSFSPTAQPFSLFGAMATRVARAAASSPLMSSSSSFLLKVDGASSSSSLIGIVGPKPRWASSSSSTSETSTKPNKKIDDDRLSAVIDAVNDRKLPPELRGQRHLNAVRSETDIMNIVEQRIWHSMEEGQFENLPGKGKPLDLSTNPHADPAEDTLYRILSRNKCAPQWVELNKEIRSNIAEWRSALQRALAYREGGNISKWIDGSEALKLQLRSINDKVFRYNLIVPFGRQMFGLKWEKELDRSVQSE